MSEPKRHHYLPQHAYLRFFSVNAAGKKVFQYQRGGRPFTTNLRNVGVERSLYSLTDPAGRPNQDLEKLVLSRLDGRTAPIMQRLNQEENQVVLSDDELDVLHNIVTFALLRTPAFRDALRRLGSELIGNPDRFYPTMRAELSALGVPEEKIESHVENALQHVREVASQRDYWLIRVGRLATRTNDALRLKRVELLVVDNEMIVTSDHPVALDYTRGVLDSDLVFPVGSRRVLVMQTATGGGNSVLPIRKISASDARQLNKQTMRHAENFLYAEAAHEKIRRLFDGTIKPTRLTRRT
jgi:hypothetical protein